MPEIDILLKTFSTRKIFYLNIISKFVSDTEKKIPALNNKYCTINRESYKKYLEKITTLKGASLHSSYIRQLQSLEKDKILRKDKNKNLKFTELGLKVVAFFNELDQFFGHDNFFKFLEDTKAYFKKKNIKLIFLYILSEIIQIAKEKNTLYNIMHIIDAAGFFEKEKIEQESKYRSQHMLKMPPTDAPLLEYLKEKDFKDLIKETALALKQLPSYKERRQKLINSLNKAFQMLLGKNFDKKNIADFQDLIKTFGEWKFLRLNDRSKINPPIGFEEKLKKILNEEYQPIYAIIMKNLGKGELIFCSETLQQNVYIRTSVSSEIIEILNCLDYISYAFNTSIENIKLIEISIPIQYIEQESKPNIYLIPYKNGFFLITTFTPLYWHISHPIKKLSISFLEQLTETDYCYYTFKDKPPADLKQFDSFVIYYLLRIFELVVDRLFFRRFRGGRIIEDLRTEEGFKSEYHDTYRVNAESLKRGRELNFEKINTKDDPLYDSEYLCNWAIPRVKIFYDNYFISMGITIEAVKKVYFQVFKAINSPNPIYSKLVKLFENSLKHFSQ